MTPADLPSMNITLSAPANLPDGTTCAPLRGWKRDDPPQIITRWELTDEELWQVISNRIIYLSVAGTGHPMVCLFTEPNPDA